MPLTAGPQALLFDSTAGVSPSVHVIQFALDEIVDHDALVALLDREEHARASQMAVALARKRYEAAHGLMRIAIGRLLNVPPAAVAFRKTPSGKPLLVPHTSDLRFNLSHSGGRALLAMANGREIGVDIERERPIDVLGLARRFLTAAEAAALAAMPEEYRSLAFFRCWTRKESFVKATGHGFALALNDFEVAVDRTTSQRVGRWTITDFPAPAGYCAAVTAERLDTPIQAWVCSPNLDLHPQLAT